MDVLPTSHANPTASSLGKEGCGGLPHLAREADYVRSRKKGGVGVSPTRTQAGPLARKADYVCSRKRGGVGFSPTSHVKPPPSGFSRHGSSLEI